MRILLTGANGQLGWELQRALQPLGQVIATTRDALDLLDTRRLRERIAALAPQVVVNAAAFAAVDQAQSHRDEAFAVNAHAVEVMADACRDCGALFVHYSTDYVFDGIGGAPYAEDASPAPVNVYGHSKLAGDRAVVASGAKHLVLRISWLYSLRRRNFLRAVLKQAQTGSRLRVVGDQRSTPTPAWFVADLSAHLIESALAGAAGEADGTWNLACAGDCSWHEFALAIFGHLAQRPELMRRLGLASVPDIEHIESRDYATAAPRPFDTRLSLARLASGGLHAMPWRDALAYTLDGLLPADPG